MPDSETVPQAAERERKPVLPPFGGSAAQAGAVLRPGTDLRGRKTLPPFFARPIRLGGPLPGATKRPPAPPLRPIQAHHPAAVTLPPARSHPEARPIHSPAHGAIATPTRSIPPTPPAPSWDTPPTPLASAVTLEDVYGGDVSRRNELMRARAEAEWATPLAEPDLALHAPKPDGALDRDPVPTVDAPALPSIAEFADDRDLPADPEYATKTQDPFLPGQGTTGEYPGATPSPETPSYAPPVTTRPARRTPVTVVRITPVSVERTPPPPPSLFADQPLASLDPAQADAPDPGIDVTQNMKSDDITDMFAENYTVQPSARTSESGSGQRRPYRETPPLGTQRIGHGRVSGGHQQQTARRGRRTTPVLGSHAVTPISVPTIRRTPMAPAITSIDPAPDAPLPVQMAVGAPSPTPIAVPALQDIAVSRAVAQALETVAAQIRAGQLVIAGQVPLGDDITALAAATAAALAALLGVQR
jgi:hypothetical protein